MGLQTHNDLDRPRSKSRSESCHIFRSKSRSEAIKYFLTYLGQGQFKIKVKVKGQRSSSTFFIISGCLTPLFGPNLTIKARGVLPFPPFPPFPPFVSL